ncbi:MAG: Asp-tRNA(Asn)/Glu-tRNA(Gln) amidotransferase subunit GatB [bacterium]
MTYSLVCGAEIHVELRTQSKMFCGCKNDPFGAPNPNIYTCPVCLGMPGALPVPNKKAIEDCILIGLALNCQISEVSKFDRKHYFYPDLGKGYQISQYDEPFCVGGYVDTSFGRVGITRVHMEEDTAKLHHETVNGEKVSLIDFNRSSVPLVEIVSDPDIKSAEQAKEFLKKVRDIVRALGVSDCDMDKGSMRLEANISLAPVGADPSVRPPLPPYKVEVKNINSFRYFANSIEYEMKRQEELLLKGSTPKQETRGYRQDGNRTESQRGKEGAADYRYFPEPDIPPFRISREMVQDIAQRLPQLPEAIIAELIGYSIPESTARVLTGDNAALAYIREINKLDPKLSPKVAGAIANKKIDITKLLPSDYVKEESTKAADKITDVAELTKLVESVVTANAQSITDYQAGKQNALGFLMGQIMKTSGGKADTTIAKDILTKLI